MFAKPVKVCQSTDIEHSRLGEVTAGLPDALVDDINRGIQIALIKSFRATCCYIHAPDANMENLVSRYKFHNSANNKLLIQA